jgi:acyl carrier protein
MTKDDILQRIVTILVETFDIEAERIVPQAKLREDLDIDSIDAVDLMVQLKPLVGQRLQPEAFKTVRTIGDVVDALHKLLVGAGTVDA